MAVDKFGGEEGFKDTINRDFVKKELCKKNGVKLCYFTDNKKYNTFLGEKIIKNENDLISTIYG